MQSEKRIGKEEEPFSRRDWDEEWTADIAAPLVVVDVVRERKEQFVMDVIVVELLVMVSAGDESVRLEKMQPERDADVLVDS